MGMKGKRILALFMAVSVLMADGSIVFAAENNHQEETVAQSNGTTEEASVEAAVSADEEEQEMAADVAAMEHTEQVAEDLPASGQTEDVAPAGTTEGELTEGDYSYTVENGTARITKYNGTKVNAVIPSEIGGYAVTSLGQDVFRNHTTVESVHIPAGVTFIGGVGDVVTTTFKGTSSLKTITVDSNNKTFYSTDGVLFRYAATDGLPMLFKYPSARNGSSYTIPNNTVYIVSDAFCSCSNLEKIIVPSTVKFLVIGAFSELSYKTIIFCHTIPAQIDLYKGFSGLEYCKIIVKNQAMKEAVASEQSKCIQTEVLLESDLSDTDKEKYLIPAKALLFDTGITTKNLTLAPEESCNVAYTLTPADTTDAVTWKSNNPSIAEVSCVNGKVTVTGKGHGQCVITGKDDSGHTLVLNVLVSIPIESIQCLLHHSQFTNSGTASFDYDFVKNDFAFNDRGERRIYFSIWSTAPKNLAEYTPTCNELLDLKITGDTDKLVYGTEHTQNGSGEEWDEHYFKVNGTGSVTINVSVEDDDGSIKKGQFTLKVSKSSISNAVVNVDNVSYNGKAQTPAIKVTLNDKELKKNTDYTVSYSNNTAPGTGKAAITGIGNYTGKKTVSFEIKKTAVEKISINGSSVKVGTGRYNGKAQKPSVTVTMNGKTLKKNTDYDVSYSNNTKPGTGTVTIKGKGNYTGTKTAEFQIYKGKQSISKVSSSYKAAYKKSFTLKPKAEGKITYKTSNRKVATVNSKGKVQIKGTGKATITVTAKSTSLYSQTTKKVTIYAIPAKMKTPSVKAGSKKLTVSWKKDSRADGYQIQYSTSSKFKKATTVTCSKKTAKTTIKKLKSGKKYYVCIRAYKKIGGKKYYGSYSKGKSVKVK